MPTGPYCNGCVNQPHGRRFIEADGSGSNGILFVGDSPWHEEAAVGKNFVGAAGQLFEKWLKWLGEPRSACTTTNSMWCSPPRLGWTDHPEKNPDAYGALQQCRPYLDELIATRKPRVIVPMGNVALRRIVGVAGIEKNQGYVHETPYDIPAVPIFHPSYVMQGKQKLSPIIIAALRKAKRIADGTYQASNYNLILDPSPDDLRAYLGRLPADLTELHVDIETPESSDIDEDDVDLDALTDDDNPGVIRDSSFNIIRAGFCAEPGVGVSFPFEAPYIGVLRDIMARSAICWEWSNRHFDSVRLAKAGLPARRWGSAMWAWHFWKSDLPKALGFAAPLAYNGPPWKHKSQEAPAWYNAMDNVIQGALLDFTRTQLKAEGRWHWFMRHCVDTDEILVQMCKPGFVVDRAVQGAFKAKVESERDAAQARLNEEVPASIRKVKTWQREPKDMTGVVVEDTGTFRKNGKPIFKYTRQEPFNPASSLQVVSLIKALGLPVHMDHRRGKATTEAKHLKKLANKAPVMRTLLECREKNKMLNTYIWPLDAEGRVFTHYGFNPSTWRKSSYNVNSQNIPKRSDLSQQFRRMIVARPGHQWVTFDSSAIEAVLVGYFAGSARYIRLAKLGVHDWVTACKVGQPIPLNIPDDELRARCKAIKKAFPNEREMIKRVVHLSNYRGTPGRIAEEYPEYFRNEQEAADLQNLYLSTDPGKDVVAWQNRTLTLAHKEHLLKIPYGYWHEFYCLDPATRVLKADLCWESVGSLKLGDELIGFDEKISKYAEFGRDLIPKTRPTVVTNLAQLDAAPRYSISTDKGNVIATPGHAWLVRMRRHRHCIHRWITTEYLQEGDEIVYFTHPWKPDLSPDAQWLAGILDGEGCIWKPQNQNRGGLQVSQNPGIVLDRIVNVSQELGMNPVMTPRHGHSAITVRLRNNHFRSVLSIVGSLRANRLIKNARATWDETPLWHSQFMDKEVAVVREIEAISPGVVIAVETSTKTLIAEGLCSHNSVFTYDKAYAKWRLGDDAKRCIAYRPQATASAIQTEIVLWVREHHSWLLPYLRLIIHDEIASEVPDELVEKAVPVLHTAFTQPWKELDGLTIGADGKVGRNLADWSLENPDGLRAVEATFAPAAAS